MQDCFLILMGTLHLTHGIHWLSTILVVLCPIDEQNTVTLSHVAMMSIWNLYSFFNNSAVGRPNKYWRCILLVSNDLMTRDAFLKIDK